MKKIILLTILLFQLTFLYGQENKWGPWNNSDCYPKIQFRAKLVSKKYYDGGSTSSDGCYSGQGYQWKVQIKNNYPKTAWVYFSGGNKSCVEKNINDGAGLNLNPNEVGELSLKDWYSDSSESIFVLIKSMAFLKSKKDNSFKNDPSMQYESCENGGFCQICRIDNSANHCPEVKISKKVNVNDAKKSLSVEELENIIISNLKQNLMDSPLTKENDYSSIVQNVFFESNILTISIKWKIQSKYRKCPSAINAYIYTVPISSLYIDRVGNDESSLGNIKIFRINSIDKIGEKKMSQIGNEYECTMGPIYESQQMLSSNDFEYNFGNNDENFTELQSAIEALRNPQTKNVVAVKESNNYVKEDDLKKNETGAIKKVTLSNKTSTYKLSLANLKKDLIANKKDKSKVKESLFTFFKSQKISVLETEIDKERYNATYYYLTSDKQNFVVDYKNKLMIAFSEEFKEYGEDLHNALIDYDSGSFRQQDGKKGYLIFFQFD